LKILLFSIQRIKTINLIKIYFFLKKILNFFFSGFDNDTHEFAAIKLEKEDNSDVRSIDREV
jgi:hypothetical protein